MGVQPPFHLQPAHPPPGPIGRGCGPAPFSVTRVPCACTFQINGMSGRVQQAAVSRQPRDEAASATTEAEKRRLKNKKKREGKEKKAAALASEGGGGEGGGGGGGEGGSKSGEGGGKSGEGTTQAAGQAAAGVEGEVSHEVGSDQGAKRAKT